MQKVALSLFLTAMSFADSPQVKFSKVCKVYEALNLQSEQKCERPEGTVIDSYRVMGPQFVQVTMAGCAGYVERQCLVVSRKNKAAPTASWKPSPPAEQRVNRLEVLGFGNFESVGSTTANSAKSSGTSYGGGLGARYALGGFRVATGLHYSSVLLSQTVTASAVSTTFSQYTKYLGLSLLSQYRVWNETNAKLRASFPLWLGGGLQFQHPLSAVQESTGGGSINYSAPRLILGLVGLTWDLSLEKMGFALSLDYYYNLSTSSGSKLQGFRGTLAFTLPV